MNTINAFDGVTLTSTESILKRQSEYFGDLCVSFKNGASVSDLVSVSATVAACQNITLQEVVSAIRIMKNEKAAGLDMVTAEMI